MADYEQAVFISYAWKGESEEIVNQIDQALQARGIKIIRDKRDLDFKGSISEFMERIGRGNCVIIVISDKYLRSENCMFELVEIADGKEFHDRIFPVVLNDADIYDPVKRSEYVLYWEQKRKSLAKKLKGLELRHTEGLSKDLEKWDRIRDKISDLTSIIKDMNTLSLDMHRESDFIELYKAIVSRLQDPELDQEAGTSRSNISTNDVHLTSQQIEKGLTRFAQYLPDRAPILQRKFDLISKKLRATLGSEWSALSSHLKKQREDCIREIISMCEEVMDISFSALCTGQTPPLYDSRPPFRGLFPFQLEDKEFYFGREVLVQKLVRRLKLNQFLTVVGSSGSGKSSLVMAGLLPALNREMVYLTPGDQPLLRLQEVREKAGRDAAYVVDQFEELFTLTRESNQREAFIKELLELARTNYIIVTMRADFWGEVAAYKDLKNEMQDHQELVAPMDIDELRSAIQQQAEAVGLQFDPGLSETILGEVTGEPGAMPLLQHALWILWERRHGRWLKADEYRAFGGIKQAIASTAEEVYLSCADQERILIQNIFLRLTHIDNSLDNGEHRRNTRRRVSIHEVAFGDDLSIAIQLLNKLADARLIVKTENEVEVAHEALISNWKRLIDWLNEDIDNLRIRQGITEAADEWKSAGYDDSLLLHHGSRLELALVISQNKRYQLNTLENAYLQACVAVREQARMEKEERQQRELDEANKRAEEYQRLTNIATARQLAAQAHSIIATRNSKQMIAVLLATQSMKLFPTGEAADILLNKNSSARPVSRITHDGEVTYVSFSPDGKYVVSGSRDETARVWEAVAGKEVARMTYDGEISFSPDGRHIVSGGRITHIWEVATGKEVARMTHEGAVHSASFSPDGRYVVSRGENTIHVWEVESGKEIASMIHNEHVNSVAFSADGKYVASGGWDNTTSVWEAATGKEIARITHDSGVNAVAFSPDSRYVVSGIDGNTVRVWEMESGKVISMNHDHEVKSVAFSPDGNFVVSGSWDNTARVWAVATGIEVARMTHDDPVTSVAFSPDGRYVVSGSEDCTACVWDIASDKEVAFMIHDGSLASICFSLDGKYVLSCGGSSACVWETATGQEVVRMAHESYVTFTAFSSDGRYIVSGCWDHTIHVWEAATGKEVTRMTHDGEVHSVSFSPDCRYVASGSRDETARVWEVSTGKEVARMTHNNIVYWVAFSPNGLYVVSASEDQTVRVWDATSGKEVARMTYGGAVHSAFFSPDGRYVVSGGGDIVQVWEVETGTEIARMTHDRLISSVAFSWDGRYVASSSYDHTARAWDAATGKEIARMIHDDPTDPIAFSPDGRYVVSGSKDNSARVWETATGKEVARIIHYAPVTSVAFSPDGRYVVSGSDDYTARVWYWQPKDLITTAYEYLPRNLTRAEWKLYIGDVLPYQAVYENLPIEPEETDTPTISK